MSDIAHTFWRDPFFWAFLSMTGWFLGLLVVGSKTLGKSTAFGVFAVALVEIPRFILPLNFVDQPRFGRGPVTVAVGAIILIVALVFGSPALRIKPFTRPQKNEPLRTTGLYSVVRHPLYFCDTFWPLGVSLMFGSIIGTAMVLVWFGVAYLFAVFEEEKLLEAYGDEYQDYTRRVRSRLIPYLI